MIPGYPKMILPLWSQEPGERGSEPMEPSKQMRRMPLSGCNDFDRRAWTINFCKSLRTFEQCNYAQAQQMTLFQVTEHRSAPKKFLQYPQAHLGQRDFKQGMSLKTHIQINYCWNAKIHTKYFNEIS